ncbi:orotidine-5'-phosphate decarboxylase [Eupransor demetentiae]|uniref:Orotidine 5'-phosphate decarboxylase n=1 Tax=Eupransor demetentiae TaxID=3109584 RepID=A0ABM9N5U1_9LACO|nr:Orotidine-5'-phosphate decarboxylase (PyrF) [Lactobacillaceae bacterium LMG 33000]
MTHPLMIALDFQDLASTKAFLNRFPNAKELTVKIGMELFYREGPAVIAAIQEYGCDIFLDLKLFDIPHTVEKAMSQLGRLGVNYVTAHTLGGSAMLAAAKKGLSEGAAAVGKPAPLLLGVTELTSISEQVLKDEQNSRLDMTDQVLSLARTAQAGGCDGIITSPLELPGLSAELGTDFKYVVPGIRMAQDQKGDQVRVADPHFARSNGAYAIVVGRPITQSSDPLAAWQQYQVNWEAE